MKLPLGELAAARVAQGRSIIQMVRLLSLLVHKNNFGDLLERPLDIVAGLCGEEENWNGPHQSKLPLLQVCPLLQAGLHLLLVGAVLSFYYAVNLVNEDRIHRLLVLKRA